MENKEEINDYNYILNMESLPEFDETTGEFSWNNNATNSCQKNDKEESTKKIEEFKEEKSSVDQGMTFIYQSKYFRPEGCKKQENDSYCNSSSKKNYKNMTFDNVKNNDDDNDSGMIYISDLDNDNADNYEEDKKESEIEIKSDDENDNDNDNYTDTNFNFNLSSAVSLSISYDIPKNEIKLKKEIERLKGQLEHLSSTFPKEMEELRNENEKLLNKYNNLKRDKNNTAG